MIRHALALAALAVTVTACGGGGSGNAEDQIRDTARRAIEAQTSSHPERACPYTVDRDGCVGAIVAARAMKLDIAALAAYPPDWRSRLAHAKITVNGDTATVSDIDGDGKPATYVLRGGRWLADNSQS